jgi:quercetin dioxygenase-like cupin family protein
VRLSPGGPHRAHHHAVGQTLHVTEGIALIGTRDGTIFEAHPGDIDTCPPGEERWHGATPERFMPHLAMWEGPGDDRPEPTWLERVTGEQYNGPRTRSR